MKILVTMTWLQMMKSLKARWICITNQVIGIKAKTMITTALKIHFRQRFSIPRPKTITSEHKTWEPTWELTQYLTATACPLNSYHLHPGCRISRLNCKEVKCLQSTSVECIMPLQWKTPHKIEPKRRFDFITSFKMVQVRNQTKSYSEHWKMRLSSKKSRKQCWLLGPKLISIAPCTRTWKSWNYRIKITLSHIGLYVMCHLSFITEKEIFGWEKRREFMPLSIKTRNLTLVHQDWPFILARTHF